MNQDIAKKLREPFPKNLIGKKPRKNKETGRVFYLDYIGHAAVTDRLLQVDPEWDWEPLSFDEFGSPRIDENGGLWIKLTIAGMTRIGYGAPEKLGHKDAGDQIKEAISDAIKNAAMRFGVALDLWSKEDLNGHSNGDSDTAAASVEQLTAEELKDIRDQVLEIHRKGNKDDLIKVYRQVEARESLALTVTNEVGNEEAIGEMVKRLGNALTTDKSKSS